MATERERRPTAAEIALFEQAMRGTAPLTDQPASKPATPPPATKPPATAVLPPVGKPPPRPSPPAAAPKSVQLDPERPIGLDRRNWLRLKRGQVTIDARLDLHGRTQDHAHRALGRFLGEAQARGERTALVVTGKGLTSGGLLRQMVPRWLNERGNRERVVAFCLAQPRHGGSGALYVLLRRHRPG
jgi:DNA-nicking Smr family endonuclease